MKESIEKRIKAVKESETSEELEKCLCSFYEKGGCPDCLTCKKTEADLKECSDYYLERIKIIPMDLWTEEFDKVIVHKREQVPLDEVTGIGIKCDTCYMWNKCPLFKKGYSCGIKWDSGIPNTPTEFMDFLICTQYERVKRSSVFEKIDGGVPDAGLSGEIDRLHGLVVSKMNMGRDRLSINVEASSPSSAQSGGILSRLFGGGNALPESKPIPISEKSEVIDTDIQGIIETKDPVKVPRQKKK